MFASATQGGHKNEILVIIQCIDYFHFGLGAAVNPLRTDAKDLKEIHNRQLGVVLSFDRLLRVV